MNPVHGGTAGEIVARPRVALLLSSVWVCRTASVVAGGGYGKTTALREVAASGAFRWVSLKAADADTEALASRLAGALGVAWPGDRSALAGATGADDRLALAERHAAWLCERAEHSPDDILLVLDDAETISDDDAVARLLRVLCLGAPPQLHVVLSGRQVPALGLGTAQGRGEVLEVAAPDLAFTVEETAELLVARLGPDSGRLAEECRSLTGGWPAALQLVVDRLRRLEPAEHRNALERLRRYRHHLWRDFAAELLDREHARTVRTLEMAWAAGAVNVKLLDAVGLPAAIEDLEALRRRGLLVDAGGPEEYGVSPVLTDIVADRLGDEGAARLRDLASRWFEANLRFEEALECLGEGPADPTRSLLLRAGHSLVRRGSAALVAEVLGRVGTGGDPRLDTIRAAALQAVGDWDGAIELFERVQRASAPEGLPAGAAWRFGVLLYLRGQSARAIETLAAAHVAALAGADDAMVSAWLSTALWSRGDVDGAADLAEIAVRQAGSSGDACALAAGHVATALVAASRGERERNDEEYRMALTAATEGGDRAQLARIHANLSSSALERADYRRAISEAREALNPGAGHRFFSALALCNEADAYMRLGELDDARAAIDEAVETYSALGSLHVCVAHFLSGELYRQRGDFTRARRAFERSRSLSEEAGDEHTVVFALAGLAKTLAPDDRDAARAAAGEALDRASSLERSAALCAMAEVDLWSGDHRRASELATAAEVEARRIGDPAALAEALELRGAAGVPPEAGRIEDALTIWDEVGNPIASARARLVLASLRDDPGLVELCRRELGELGVTAGVGVAGLLATLTPGGRGPDVSITTLGRFSVTRNGETVPLAAWQSRKARDLLKLLAARRGRPITRDFAIETLWPGLDASSSLGNRLSVALSTVRKVLDPTRRCPPDHYVVADAQSIALRLENLSIDVVTFLDLAAAACAAAALVAAGPGGWAGAPATTGVGADRDMVGDVEARLQRAMELYAGDFLEEDLYEDWTISSREEARSAALMVMRNLARVAALRRDDEAVTQHLGQLLERDPYDEDAWLALVAAQLRLRRHGEARRRYAVYARRMAELGVVPVALSDTVDRRP